MSKVLNFMRLIILAQNFHVTHLNICLFLFHNLNNQTYNIINYQMTKVTN